MPRLSSLRALAVPKMAAQASSIYMMGTYSAGMSVTNM